MTVKINEETDKQQQKREDKYAKRKFSPFDIQFVLHKLSTAVVFNLFLYASKYIHSLHTYVYKAICMKQLFR